MTDKFKQIADCYGPGDFNDLEAKYIEVYVKHAARDVHLMWDEIQRLRQGQVMDRRWMKPKVLAYANEFLKPTRQTSKCDQCDGTLGEGYMVAYLKLDLNDKQGQWQYCCQTCYINDGFQWVKPLRFHLK